MHAGMTIAGSRSAAYFEAQRRIAVTIRNMYEVGQRVPPQTSAMSLSAAQAWDSSHREVCLQLKTHLPATLYGPGCVCPGLPGMQAPASASLYPTCAAQGRALD